MDRKNPVVAAFLDHAKALRTAAKKADQLHAAALLFAADQAEVAASRYVGSGRVTVGASATVIPGQMEIPGCDK